MYTFTKKKGDKLTLAFIHVDDGMVASNDPDELKRLTQVLKSKYKLKLREEVNWFLGIKIERDRQKKTITLSQESYIDKLVEKFRLQLANSVKIPMSVSDDYSEQSTDQEKVGVEVPYRELIGSMMYILVTRPEISYSISKLSESLNCPSKKHWTGAKKILRYLKGTKSFGLV